MRFALQPVKLRIAHVRRFRIDRERHPRPEKRLWDQYIRANCAVSKNVKCGTAQH
jgi:hypothetical protein